MSMSPGPRVAAAVCTAVLFTTASSANAAWPTSPYANVPVATAVNNKSEVRDDTGRGVAPGLYLLRLESGGRSTVGRMVVVP